MSQTPQQYFDTWNGKGIDFDGYFGDQCMDNFLQYNQDVVGAPRVWGNAIDVPNTYPKDFYDLILNNPNDANQIPQKGDVIIFKIGQYGHISMFFAGAAGSSKFTSFDQNWNGHQYCEYVVHDYIGDNVFCWLRPKKLPTSPSSSPSNSVSPSSSPSRSLSPSSSPSHSQSPSASPSPSSDPTEDMLLELKSIIFGKWSWFGINGWKNRLQQLKNIYG